MTGAGRARRARLPAVARRVRAGLRAGATDQDPKTKSTSLPAYLPTELPPTHLGGASPLRYPSEAPLTQRLGPH
eukprot:scaffold92278_cov62-Phaeocystis_antarctica.AAC.4